MLRKRLNAYRIMWLFVFFDLPTNKKPERKRATKFRKWLLKNGFIMLQYSVYIRHCASKEHADMHRGRIKAGVPKKGHVSILTITDKQYGRMLNYWGLSHTDPPGIETDQLNLF